MKLNSVCVFCGSSSGDRPAYRDSADAMGRALAGAKLGLVYGGGHVGLMGTVANATLAAGGQVTGIIPKALYDKEVGHDGLTRLEIVGSMHERKARMAELADAFVALPGGLGTFEELFEVWTWAQLGWHPKPVALLDVDGFYRPLIQFLDEVVARGFVRRVHREMLIVATEPADLLEKLAAYQPPQVVKWIDAKSS
jgi:uncharacterized protein (TIGR00730 family)